MIDWKVMIGEAATQLLRVIIPVCVCLVIKWAIQLYETIKKNQPDFAAVLGVAVNNAVIAAESLLFTEEGKKKKEYAIASVQEFLAQKGLAVDVGVIEDAIEAAVYSMHRDNFFLSKEQIEAAKRHPQNMEQVPPVQHFDHEGEING